MFHLCHILQSERNWIYSKVAIVPCVSPMSIISSLGLACKHSKTGMTLTIAFWNL